MQVLLCVEAQSIGPATACIRYRGSKSGSALNKDNVLRALISEVQFNGSKESGLMKKNRVPANILLLSILSGMFFLALSVVLWGANRGLGFGDEGIYILASRYPGEIRQNVSAIFAFTGYLFTIANYNPVTFRVLGVFAVLLSAAVFWYGFQKLLVKLQPESVDIKYLKYYSLLFIVTGSLLHFQFSYLTPSYYTLTAVVVNLFAGCVALGLSRLDKEKKSQPTSIFFVAGMVFGFTLFFKFPTAIPLLLCAVAIIFFQYEIALFARLRLVAAILFGFVAWLAIYFIFERSPLETLDMFQAGWSLYQTLGFHNPLDKLLTYPKDLAVLIYTAVFEYRLCYFIILIWSIISLVNNKFYHFQEVCRLRRAVIWGVVVIALMISLNSGLVVIVPERFITSPVEGRTRPYIAFQLGWILLLSALYLFCLPRNGLKAFCFDKTSVFFLFLLLMPVAGSLGTSNPIYNVVQFYAVPWFGAILLLVVLLVVRNGLNSALLMVVSLSISAYVSNHVAQGSTFMPAQVKPRSLFDQSVPTSVGNPAYILNLDPDTHNVISQLSIAAKASGFKGGDDIIAFSEIPGLVYALGGRSPGHPVYPCCYSVRPDAYSKMALTFSERARLRKAYVLLNMEPVDNIHSILGSVGVNFPDDYLVLTRVNGLGFNFTLYKPKGL